MTAPRRAYADIAGAGHAGGPRALAPGRRVVAPHGAAHPRRDRRRARLAVQGPRRGVRRVAAVSARRRLAHDRLARDGAHRQTAHEGIPRGAQPAGVRVARPAPADAVRDARRVQGSARRRDGRTRCVERRCQRRSARRPRILRDRASRAAARARLARRAASPADDLHAVVLATADDRRGARGRCRARVAAAHARRAAPAA